MSNLIEITETPRKSNTRNGLKAHYPDNKTKVFIKTVNGIYKVNHFRGD